MKDRKAFDLTRIISVFNLYQITANAYVFAMVLESLEMILTEIS